MAMQAFSVVVGLIELDVLRNGRRPEIVDIDMLQPAEFGFHSSKHRVAGVARITSLFGWDAVILEMRGGQMSRIIDKQALPVGFHDVTRQTEFRALGMLKFGRANHPYAQDRQGEQHQKRHHFPAASRGDAGPKDNHGNKNDGQC